MAGSLIARFVGGFFAGEAFSAFVGALAIFDASASRVVACCAVRRLRGDALRVERNHLEQLAAAFEILLILFGCIYQQFE